jgi:hypothetical protein
MNGKIYGQYSGRHEAVFSLLYLIRPAGRILCSPEQSKLCFELLEMYSAAQNNLPLQGA